MIALQTWFVSARPKSLTVSISPVLIGAFLTLQYQKLMIVPLILCLFFSLTLQIAANWLNDYYDFLNGVDTPQRKCPLSAIQEGKILPQNMRNAAIGALLLAALLSIPLLMNTGFQFMPLVAISLLCAYLYTGGKRPLGYVGLGDVLVFAFYGPIATCGTVLSQMGTIPNCAWIASIIPGSLSCAILCVNNLRDMEGDRLANKMTLVARFGKQFGQIQYFVCIAAAFAALHFLSAPSLYYMYLLLPLTIKPFIIIIKNQNNLDKALELTAQFLAIYSIIFCIIISLHTNN